MKILRIFKLLLGLIIFGASILLSINLFVVTDAKHLIITPYDAKQLKDVDAVLVLGAGLKNGGPSDMLKERLDTGVSLYQENNDLILLMSGDHLRKDYDEVNVMKRYTVLNDVPSSSIFMDHAGISTYDSLKRAKEIFGVKKLIIVTQEYHLYRALYIASSLGIEAYGVDATKKIYPGQRARDLREVLAITKDFFKTMIKPNSKIGGDKISLDGDGNKTNDEYILLTNKYTDEETFSGSSVVVSNVSNLLMQTSFLSEVCDGKSKYEMNINGNKYDVEVYDANIHIRLNDKEAVFNKEDAEAIMDLIR